MLQGLTKGSINTPHTPIHRYHRKRQYAHALALDRSALVADDIHGLPVLRQSLCRYRFKSALPNICSSTVFPREPPFLIPPSLVHISLTQPEGFPPFQPPHFLLHRYCRHLRPCQMVGQCHYQFESAARIILSLSLFNPRSASSPLP